MIIGFMWGSVVGGSLGAVIGGTYANRRTGIIMGLAIGLLIAVVLLFGCYDCRDPLVFALIVIVSCSMLGWLLSSTLPARERPE